MKNESLYQTKMIGKQMQSTTYICFDIDAYSLLFKVLLLQASISDPDQIGEYNNLAFKPKRNEILKYFFRNES